MTNPPRYVNKDNTIIDDSPKDSILDEKLLSRKTKKPVNSNDYDAEMTRNIKSRRLDQNPTAQKIQSSKSLTKEQQNHHMSNAFYLDNRIKSMSHIKQLDAKYRNPIVPVLPSKFFSKSSFL